MKKNHILLSMIAILLSWSCNQKQLKPEIRQKQMDVSQIVTNERSFSSNPYWGYAHLTCVDNNANVENTPHKYAYGGQVLTPTIGIERLNGGKMTIGNIELYPDPNNQLNYGTFGPNPSEESAAKPLFGQMLNFSLEGNSSTNVPAFSTSFYVPKVLEADIFVNEEKPDYKTNFSPNSTVHVTWNADSNNEYGVLLYSLTQPTDGSDPIFAYEVIPDNGQINVNYQKFFSHITDRTHFVFGIARGNGKEITVNERQFMVYSLIKSQHNFWMYF